MLTNEQFEKRLRKIGGSDARTIMYGDHEQWQALYQEKVNGVRPVFKPEQQLLMDMGNAIEPLCLREYARKVKPLAKMPPEHTIAWKVDPYFMFSPDGLTTDGHAVQCKYHGGDKSIMELADFYAPQVLHEMLCLGRSKGDLAVIFGHYGRFMHIEIERDEKALDAYLMRAMQFKDYMETGEMPETMAAAAAGIVIPRRRDHVWPIGDNMVAPLARQVIENAPHAVKFDDALSGLKAMVPNDAATATWVGADGNGITFKIAKNGAKRWFPVLKAEAGALAEAMEAAQ